MEGIPLPPLGEHWDKQRSKWIKDASLVSNDLTNGAWWARLIAAKTPWGQDVDDGYVNLPEAALRYDLSPVWVEGWTVIERLHSRGLVSIIHDSMICPEWPVEE